MKNVYLCQSAQTLHEVYNNDESVFAKEDVLANADRFRDTECIFSTWGMPAFTEEEIKAYLPNLKAVFYAAGSVQAFARPFLNCGVRVFSAWTANAVPVAEYTLAQILLANKGCYALSRMTKQGMEAYEASWEVRDRYPGNYGVKVGIIGAGMIGKLVIKLLKAYDLEVLVFDPFLADEAALALDVTKVPLAQLFAECQVVSNHLADNEQTKGMLTGELFASMRPYATFLNTGRGAQVNEAELVAVLRERADLTAVLDVCTEEPPAANSGFYELENCILTPHMAGSRGQELHRMAAYMQEAHRCFVNGEPSHCEVTAAMLKTMA